MRLAWTFVALAVAGCAGSPGRPKAVDDLRQQDETHLCKSQQKVLELPDRTFALGGELGRLSLAATGELRLDERLLGRLDESGCFRAPDGEILAEWSKDRVSWMREPHPYLRISIEPRRLTSIGKAGFRGQTLIEDGRVHGAYDHTRWKVLGPEQRARPELALRMQLLNEMMDARCEGEEFVELPDDDWVVERESGTRTVLTSDGTLSHAGIVVGRLDSTGCFFDASGAWAARWTPDGRLIQRGDASWGYVRFRLEGSVLRAYSGEAVVDSLRLDGLRLVPAQGPARFRLLAPRERLKPAEVATLLRVVLLPDLLRLAGQRGADALDEPTSLD